MASQKTIGLIVSGAIILALLAAWMIPSLRGDTGTRDEVREVTRSVYLRVAPARDKVRLLVPGEKLHVLEAERDGFIRVETAGGESGYTWVRNSRPEKVVRDRPDRWAFWVRWGDAVLITLLVSIHLLAWHGVRRASSNDPYAGANALIGASAGGITAVSILMPVTFLLIENDGLASFGLSAAAAHLERAAIWFIASLIAGLFTLFVAPMRAAGGDAIYSPQVGIPFGIQVLLLFAGILRFSLGLKSL
jgi:hypothetical protein